MARATLSVAGPGRAGRSALHGLPTCCKCSGMREELVAAPWQSENRKNTYFSKRTLKKVGSFVIKKKGHYSDLQTFYLQQQSH